MTLEITAIDLHQSLSELRAALDGAAYVPGDEGYDAARSAWNLAVEQRPAVIVAARSSSDVAAGVRFARAHDLAIAVQSTGHGLVLPGDESLLINMAAMNDVRIDPERRTAWVGGGAIWEDVLYPAQERGLAPLLGSSPNVGVVGYTVGGGMGWLARKHGLSTDSVNEFRVVTADGFERRVAADENADLFWALRGGGGSFGIVTGLEIRLYPVSTVFAGNLIYPASEAAEVLRFFREWVKDAPEELTSGFSLMNMPPFPSVPEPLRGQSVVMVRGLYAGPVAEGEALLQRWLNWKAPMMNGWRAMPFTDIAEVSQDPLPPTPSYVYGAWLADMSDETIEALIGSGVRANGTSPMIFTEVRHSGGAVTRGGAAPAAFSHRDAPFVMHSIGSPGLWADMDGLRAHGEATLRALGSHADGAYLNFVFGPEGRAGAQRGFSAETLARLQAIKAAYDPDSVFRFGWI